jgi:hypothetical protein
MTVAIATAGRNVRICFLRGTFPSMVFPSIVEYRSAATCPAQGKWRVWARGTVRIQELKWRVCGDSGVCISGGDRWGGFGEASRLGLVLGILVVVVNRSESGTKVLKTRMINFALTNQNI